MCGIAGIFGERNPDRVDRMLRRLQHRGPDDDGVYAGSRATLGIRRLAIIDLVTGAQPIANEDGSLWIVFNGEIYNYRELRDDLEGRGHRFATRTDTEVILHLFEEKGTETPGSLRGDFAFAIWDEKTQKGFLARDHLGVKPVYYAPLGRKLLFSSELKGLLDYPELPLRLDPKALELYSAFLYIPSPWTIFEGVFKLPPGSFLTFENGQAGVASYWKPPTEQIRIQDREELEQRIHARLREAVTTRLVSDVPLGAFLSGGIDSTAVVALMAAATSQPVRTFSVGYGSEFSSFNELEHSRFVAQHYGTHHEEFIIHPDIRQTISEIAEVLDEPFGDSSAIPTYLVSRETARSVKVALSGVGGDELFGGYPRYLGTIWDAGYRTLPLPIRRLLSYCGRQVPEMESSRNVGGWIRDFLRDPEEAPLDRYRDWVSFNTAEERRRLFSREFFSRIRMPCEDSSYFQKLVSPVAHWEPPDQALYVDLVSYLVHDLLFMSDHMGMAHSLEIRVPFCDHRLVEDLIRCPWRSKIGPFQLKKLLKRLLKHDLPRRILRRKKQGFMVPVGAWMKGELRQMFEHYFSAERLRRQNIFNPEQVQQLFRAHLAGKARNTNQLWGLLVFQLWHEKMEKRLS